MNPSVEIIFLEAIARVKTNNWMISRTIIDRFTQAALLKDQHGNIFLFRRKRKNVYFVGEIDLHARLLEMAKAESKDINFQKRRIPRELFLKIEDWTVERSDIADYFIEKKFMMLSLAEAELIEKTRMK